MRSVTGSMSTPDRFILIDWNGDETYRDYQALTAAASDEDPPWVDVDNDDIYNIVYSSGTTGLPKGIVHTHAIREAYATGFTASYRIKPESVILHSGSLVFNGAFLTLMPAFYLGATYVLMPAFDARKMIDLMATGEGDPRDGGAVADHCHARARRLR